MKKFVTIGLGNFGLNLAKSLVDNGCEVLGIDTSSETVHTAKDMISHAIIADATNKEVLSSLSLSDFDGAIVSIGQDMAPSILIALYLKEIGMEKIIVRAISEDHGKILEKIGVSEIIFPERDMAVRLADRLSLKNALDYLPISEDYGIVEVNPPVSFLEKTLAELQIPNRFDCQVVGIKDYPNGQKTSGLREPEMTVKIAPSASQKITKKSIMIIIGKYSDIEKIQALD